MYSQNRPALALRTRPRRGHRTDTASRRCTASLELPAAATAHKRSWTSAGNPTGIASSSASRFVPLRAFGLRHPATTSQSQPPSTGSRLVGTGIPVGNRARESRERERQRPRTPERQGPGRTGDGPAASAGLAGDGSSTRVRDRVDPFPQSAVRAVNAKAPAVAGHCFDAPEINDTGQYIRPFLLAGFLSSGHSLLHCSGNEPMPA